MWTNLELLNHVLFAAFTKVIIAVFNSDINMNNVNLSLNIRTANCSSIFDLFSSKCLDLVNLQI